VSLFSSIQVSASGMAAQRARTEVLVENLANSETTRTPDGGPYRRKDVVFSEDSSIGSFSSQFDSALGPTLSGVAVSEVSVDESAPEMRYQPGHPDANKDGYVAYPKINPAEDMVDLLGASRGYEANVAAISAVKDMINKSLDLFRS
jgi:flagellar basal-body rod protein FlgC